MKPVKSKFNSAINARYGFYIGPLGLLFVLAILAFAFYFMGNTHQKVWHQVSVQYFDALHQSNITIQQFNQLEHELLLTILSGNSRLSEEEIYDRGIGIIDNLDQTSRELEHLLTNLQHVALPENKAVLEQLIQKLRKLYEKYEVTVRSTVEMSTVDLTRVAEFALDTTQEQEELSALLNEIRIVAVKDIQNSSEREMNQYNTLYQSVWIIMLIFTITLLILSIYISRHADHALLYIHSSLLKTAQTVSPSSFKDTRNKDVSFDTLSTAVDTFSNAVIALDKQQQATEAAQQRAETANQAKSFFLSAMSHEFRTPLNAIMGFGQLMESTPLDDEQEEYLHYIGENSHKLLEMVNKLLLLTDIEAISTVNIHPVSCQSLIASLDDYALSILPQGMTYRSEIDPGCDMIEVDPKWGYEVIRILLSNAVMYNQADGHVVLHVSFITPHEIKVSVSDTGAGISEDKQAELFEPFERLDKANSAISGSGVGLTIAKKLTNVMHGKLGFHSELGKGSTFWVSFPSSASNE
jgi:signal transduction histidine kinase